MKRTINLTEHFKQASREVKMHITSLHELFDNMPEECILGNVGIIPPCKTNPSSGRREFDWQVAVDLQEKLSYLTNQLPMAVLAVKPDEDFQVVKLVNILRDCMVVIVPDEVEENLESAYLASECDGMAISYSDAERKFKHDLERFKEFPRMIEEIKSQLS